MKHLLETHEFILAEAAVVERLCRNEKIQLHESLVNALLVLSEEGRAALRSLYQEYIDIAASDRPILLSTPPGEKIRREW